jgi:uncharacterized protein YaiL (DUF2058 family)
MKIIKVDNFDRDNVSDKLIADGISSKDAESIVSALNAKESEDSPDFYKAVPDDHELYVYDPS